MKEPAGCICASFEPKSMHRKVRGILPSHNAMEDKKASPTRTTAEWSSGSLAPTCDQ